MSDTDERPAGIYCRISSDPEGTRVGVDRQERDCRRLALAQGWPEVEVYVDNDASAFSGVTRPGYRRMLEDLALRRLAAVISWDPDRLHRSSLELEQFLELVDLVGVPVLTVTAGRADLGSPSGRLQLRIKGTIARYESEHKSERLVAAHQALADAGRFKGGRPPYGYDINRDNHGRPLKDGRLHVVEEQADVIREAARRVLAGESVYAICKDFNERGLLTVSGKHWRTSTLRWILMNPATAGLRTYRGEVVGPGLWPALVSAEEHDRLLERLGPKRARGKPSGGSGGNRRSFLLTGGLAVCGLCGQRLTSMRRSNSVRAYRCVQGPDTGGCGRITVNADGLEHEVRRAACQRLLDHDADTGDLAMMLARMLIAGDLPPEAYRSARCGLFASDVVYARMAASPDEHALAALHEIPLEGQRSFILGVVDHVVIRPTETRGRFDPTRVIMVWHGPHRRPTGRHHEIEIVKAPVQLAMMELAVSPDALRRPPNDEQISRLYRTGLTIEQVAEAVGSKYWVVQRSLKRSGTPTRAGGLPRADDAAINELYRDGWSQVQIADHLSISRFTVRASLDRSGTDRRPRGSRPRTPGSDALAVRR